MNGGSQLNESRPLISLVPISRKSRARSEPILLGRIVAGIFSEDAMKPLIFASVIWGLALIPAAVEAKGCIKGAVVGGVAGHMAGDGKVGPASRGGGGRYQTHKGEAQKTDQKTPPS